MVKPNITGCGGWAINTDAIRWIFDNIKEGSTIVELGSGSGTTGNLCKAYNLFSVENDAAFIGRYSSKYIHAPLVDGWYDEKIVVANLPTHYDLLLIDGPIGDYRPNFVHHSHVFIPNIPIILDDSQRSGEKLILEHLHTKGYVTKLNSSSSGGKCWTYLVKS